MPLPSVDEVRAHCAQLREEPMLHASLGSKELFHSNLLGWMVERFPDHAREVLAPWLAKADHHTKDDVRREWRHVDLRLDLRDHETVLVENKTFALPREDQLERYTSDALPLVPGSPTLLMLSLIDPMWTNDIFEVLRDGQVVATWQHVSYRELDKRLQSAFPVATGDFAEQVVAHEAQLMLMINDLVGLLAEVGSDDPVDLAPGLLTPLREVRLADVVRKVRMQAVLGLIRRRLRDERVELVKPRSKVDFTNGTPLIEVFATIDPVTGMEAGWQFQGGQWRLALVMHEEALVGDSRHHLRVEEGRRRLGIFDFDHFATSMGQARDRDRHEGDQSADFNRFAPKMIHRYRKLPPTATIGQFVDGAVAYAHHLAEQSTRRKD